MASAHFRQDAPSYGRSVRGSTSWLTRVGRCIRSRSKPRGPFGGLPPQTYPVDLSDRRGVTHRPAGSLHQVAMAIEKLAGDTRQEP